MARLLLGMGLLAAGLLRLNGGSAAVDPDPPQWGTVKGRVVFGEDKIPPNPAVAGIRPRACLAKGPILKNELVVNPKNKGVRWALVWLTGVDDPTGTKSIPTHESFKKMPKSVEIDIPCCVFEPRIVALCEGQTLVIKNSSAVPHGVGINGGALGPNITRLLAAKGSGSWGNLKARYLPVPLRCAIHPWMSGYIGVFKHPYFTVTDADGNFTIENAPGGKYRLMIWQESAGWVIINPKDLRDRGKVIHIAGDKVTDVGKVSLVVPKD